MPFLEGNIRSNKFVAQITKASIFKDFLIEILICNKIVQDSNSEERSFF